ncbi:hypothetical protein CHS0354_014275 [Potamilus streckersoni]|uniref:Uncharacterized protein n=1 Tax=Potamilus streckersoni TaxID=2493646 RepID=A0AAE0VYK9_9BIVA|nr:hypothetical protein CHS0354_014275 [Potamilus streckersoni]
MHGERDRSSATQERLPIRSHEKLGVFSNKRSFRNKSHKSTQPQRIEDISLPELGHYQDLHLTTHALLLAELYETLRETPLNKHYLDTTHYYSDQGMNRTLYINQRHRVRVLDRYRCRNFDCVPTTCKG